MKLKLTPSIVLQDSFATSFDKLCEDMSLSVSDRWALARTLKGIRSNMDIYEGERRKLVKQLGKPEIEVLELQLGRITNEPLKKAIEAKIENLKASKTESYSIDDQDAEAMKSFREKLTELQGQEFEIFLDHPIALSEKTTLSAKDISALEHLVHYSPVEVK